MEIKEPGITRKDVLILDDDDFCKENVCIVTGCGTGIGRAVTVAAAVNGLTVAGLDINAEQGEKTVDTARALDGTDVAFIPTDLTDDVQVRAAVKKAAGLGQIRYLANIAGIQHIDAVENFPMEPMI